MNATDKATEASEPSSGGAVLAAFAAGAVFGLGLAIAQMTRPQKVLAFLDVLGAWDPSLLFVLGAAVCTTALGYALVLRRPRPWFDRRFWLADRHGIDWRLVLGSALFGAGWGLAGYCPGPGISSLGSLNTEACWFVPAMVLGGLLARRLDRRAASADTRGPQPDVSDGVSCG